MSRNYIVTLIFILILGGSISLVGRFVMPAWWYIILVGSYILLNALGSTILSLQYFVPVKSRGQQQDTIAITFDDGPIAGKTEKILEILQQHNIKSCFFCIGNRVKENPDLANQIHIDGHLLGNHSYWHSPTFDLQFSNTIIKELTQTDEIFKKIVGVKPRFFRPPYGVTNPMVSRAVRKKKYVVVGWNIRSFDTIIKNPTKLSNRVTRSLKGGDIVLFHDSSETMIEILPAFLEHVAKVGLKVVRLDELLNEKAYEV